MDPLLEQFLSEAQDNLSYLDAHLKDLESGDPEQVNALFRAAHTLKGGAGLVGFEAVKEITHAAEDLLDAYRNGRVSYSDALLDALYDAFDEVIELVDAAEAAGDLAALEVDQSRVDEVRGKVRALLDGVMGQQADTQPDTAPFEPPFSLVEAVPLTALNLDQLTRILPHVPADPVIPDVSWQSTSHAWVVNLDLDQATLELGNDPVYLLDLLGEQALVAVEPHVRGCDALRENPLQWSTWLKCVVLTDGDTLEEVFYNLIYEIEVAPLNWASLLTPPEGMEPAEIAALVDGLVWEAEALRAAAAQQQGAAGWVLNRLADLLEAGMSEAQQAGLRRWLGCGTDAGAAPAQADDVPVAVEESELDEPMRAALKALVESQREALTCSEVGHGHIVDALRHMQATLGQPCLPADASSEDAAETIEMLARQLGLASEGDSKANAPQVEQDNATVSAAQSPESGTAMPESRPTAHAAESSQTAPARSAPSQPAQTHHMPRTIKIDQEQIDELMDIVGELLVVKNALPFIAEAIEGDNAQQVRRELMSQYEQISRLVGQLQDRVMGMRLLPLSYIFSRYPKLVRDISRKLGKKIEYKEYGGETKLDKMMIEKLADPMVHIIRNSLDHGLETEEERIAAGKPPVGTLTVGARSEGDRVIIEVKDDGRGIDVDKVINKALEKRLIDPEQIDRMSEEEKLGLIFLPGLSTKDEISDLSGRGVGADAVKTTVEELGGKVIVRSRKGQGTSVLLELPVSVALTSVFQVRMGGQNYAVSMEHIVETEKVTRADIRTASHQPIIELRGEVLPLVRFEQLLGRTEFNETESVLILNTASGKIAFVVDDFVGQLDVVQKPLSGPLAAHPFISGVALLGDGSPLFILNLQKMFD
ncbi:chemotaxis protein CheA [Sulfurivirga sp.]|uniref:chemotaxis protein CheA n=1 Tax=Sulfurivirga sp. TaxID=2614236 RepID=UPI0025E98552|nr:chemotaxis protein CheA [Sulfurivirga sp.]